MNVKKRVAVVTGAASGIGLAVATELADRGAGGLALVDRNEAVLRVAKIINDFRERHVADAMIGDVTDPVFRGKAYDLIQHRQGTPSICVPAAGITRDRLGVKVDRQTELAENYPLETFREVLEVNLVAPIYWALEMVARIAEDRHRAGKMRWGPAEGIQGTIVLIGSVSAQGNPGQIAYAATKAGLGGAAATLAREAMYYGVRAAVIHPGFTDTPMVRALGEEFIKERILPHSHLRRLILPEEIADAIYFLICNSAVSGELWADAGWHPSA